MHHERLQVTTLALVALGLLCSRICAVPGAPTITWPASGALVESNVPDITWSGSGYNSFECHICTVNDPNSGIVWDSGQVYSTANTVMTGYLGVQTTYYAFVRLNDGGGWSGWSAGNSFYVNGQFLNDPYIIANSGLEWYSYAAYNPERNEYLMTWQNGYVIHWRRLDSTGAVTGSEYVLSDDSSGHHFSVVCYNSAQDEYLLAYSVWMADNSAQVRVLRINANTGAQIGSPIWVYSTGLVSTTGGIRVGYSPTSNSYLIVFEAYSEQKVYCQLLNTTGTPVGSRVQVSTPSQQYCRTPSIAWNSVNNEYLVTYLGYVADPSWDFFGQRVRASDGALLGSNFAITTTHDAANSGVAYDPIMNRYLAVCEAGATNPWGQFVSNTGTLIGSKFTIGSGNFVGWGPNVCYDSTKQEFLVGWSGTLSYGNYARRVSQSGACIGEPFKVCGGWEWVGIGNWPPMPVYNSVNDEFMIHWHNSYATILDRRYKTSTAPTMPPGPVTNFAAAAGSGQNVLTWTNPPDASFTGTLIRFKTNGYPSSPTDGTQIYNSNGTTHTHTGLTNGVTYYYTAWAHDSVPVYSAGAYAAATPSTTPGLVIVPQPQEWTWKAGTGFLVNGSTQIMANSNPDAKEQNMAQQLQRKIWDTTGYLPTIVYGGSATSNVIAVGDPARCPAVNSIIATWSEASGKASKTEGYMLGVKDTSIVIRGWDNAGTFYGSQTLIQLLEYFKTTRITPAFSYDYPELPYRGVYMRVKWEHDWDFTKELLSEMIARYKCNYFSPEIHMVSVSHPEIEPPNENPVLLGSAQDLLNFTTTHYMNNIVTWYPGPPQGTPMPEECIFDPTRLARANDLANDVKVYLNPPYVHVHESELSSLGCAAERAVYSNEYLFNQMLWQDWDRSYVQRGMWPFMWADMLRPDMGGGTMGTANVVATMPDMIIADWEYGSPGNVPTDYPTLDRWIQYGRKAVGTPFGVGSYPPYNQYYGDKENIYYWANAVYNRRSSYPNNMLGLLAWNKYMANNRNVVVGTSVDNLWQQQCLGCYPYYAEWAWNPNGRYWNPYPYGNGWSMVERQISPDRVSGLSASPSGSNVILNWTNPPESKFQAAYIVYRTDRFATSPIDGTYLADVAGSPNAPGAYTHVSAPQNGVYYSVFAHDNVRHFAPEATTYVGPAGICFQETFTYTNGTALNGNGGWSGSATASHIVIDNNCVKILGGSQNKDAVKTVSCAADGTGYITVTCKINGEVGDTTMWNLWIDDPSAKNLARWYGSGTTVRGRIGTTGTVTTNQTLSGAWQTIKVKIHPVNNTTEFFFEGNSLGVYSHAVTGAGDTLGRLRFERIHNDGASGHYLYFDDLTVGEAAQVNNAQVVSDNIPLSMVAGQQYNVTVTMRNTGTTTWSYADGYKLGGVGDSDPFVSGLPRVLLNVGETVAPNAQKAFNFTMTAPAAPDTYTTDWRMVQEWVEWFGGTLTEQVTVNASGYCFQDVFGYPDGALNGNGGWSGSAGASQIEAINSFVRVWGGAGSYDAVNTMSCSSSPSGFIWVRILAYLGSGADTIWSVWIDDSSGHNFGRWYGTGSTARGRIGGTANVTTVQNLQGNGVWDSLVMKIDPAANTTQFYFNGEDLGTLSHASEGTGDVVGRVRFERINNSSGSGQFVYLDNVRISPY